MFFFGGKFFKRMLLGSALLSIGRYFLRNRRLNSGSRTV